MELENILGCKYSTVERGISCQVSIATLHSYLGCSGSFSVYRGFKAILYSIADVVDLYKLVTLLALTRPPCSAELALLHLNRRQYKPSSTLQL